MQLFLPSTIGSIRINRNSSADLIVYDTGSRAIQPLNSRIYGIASDSQACLLAFNLKFSTDVTSFEKIKFTFSGI